MLPDSSRQPISGDADLPPTITVQTERPGEREVVVSTPVEPDDEADGWMDEVGLGVTPAEPGSRCEGVEHGGPSVLSAHSSPASQQLLLFHQQLDRTHTRTHTHTQTRSHTHTNTPTCSHTHTHT